MAKKKRVRKPNFSKMTTDELKAAYDPKWSKTVRSSWEAEMRQREEPLEKQLRLYLQKLPAFYMLQHPVYTGPCDPKRSAWLNFWVQQTLDQVEILVDQKEWGQVMMMTTRPYRLEAFLDYREQFDDKTYWKLLADLWTDQEELWPHRDVFLELLHSERAQRQLLMTVAERRKLSKLPDEFPVYRGYSGRRGKSLSWTLDQSKAEWFARRSAMMHGNSQPRLMEGVARKGDVVAYFDGRDEKEIVIDPAKVLRVKTRKIADSTVDEEFDS